MFERVKGLLFTHSMTIDQLKLLVELLYSSTNSSVPSTNASEIRREAKEIPHNKKKLRTLSKNLIFIE